MSKQTRSRVLLGLGLILRKVLTRLKGWLSDGGNSELPVYVIIAIQMIELVSNAFTIYLNSFFGVVFSRQLYE